MKIKFTATSKTPSKTAEAMMDSGSRHLWHKFDSSECKDWEMSLSKRKGILYFETFYEGTIEEKSGIPDILLDSLVEHFSKKGFKFTKEVA